MTSRSYTPTTSITIHPPAYSLHPLLSLPNELLHSIVEYIAYTYEPESDTTWRSSTFKQTSPELLALSVANCQLRQLCLPFLFANIAIYINKDVQRLKDDLALLSKYTKMLSIDEGLTESGDQTLSQLLPQLKQLCDVELRTCRDLRTDLLRAILAHPKVTSVLVDEFPEESMCNDDLSKLIIDRTTGYQDSPPEFDKYLNRGMRIMCLELFKFDNLRLDTQFGSKLLSGLQEIQIFNYSIPELSSWLPVLSSTHSTLKELWLCGTLCRVSDHAALPFLSLFIQKCQQQNLINCFVISRLGLRRSVSQFSQVWSVIDITLGIGTSLIQLLTLIAISFPKIERLTLSNLNQDAGRYDIADFTSVFARFSSLRVISFENVFGWLKFGSESDTPTSTVQRAAIVHDLKARVKSGLLVFTSCLAKQVRTLDSIYISEMGSESDNSGNHAKSWHLSGWLHVLNGNRDIGGTLK
ncbi:hypothetical protein C8R42DRAFT_689647 [Lentinula raphanica]|nr:hypothetical protein C8R42DRAFT_689647 [Lentinula raphanica]